jgi:esterase/lipase superfamily enzyme
LNEFYHKWYSNYINADYEMLVFGTGGIPVLFFPPAKERYFSAKDNGLISVLSPLIEQEKIKIYTPDSYDNESWYNFAVDPEDRVEGYKAFETHIINDIIGFIKYETSADRIIMAGAGFGGYHSLNFTLKHPDLVRDMISVDGFFDIKQFIFGYYNDDCYFNNPPDYLPGLEDQWYIERLKETGFYFGLTNSRYSPENQYISSLLDSKGIKNILYFLDSGSGWKNWSALFYDFLSMIMIKY